MRLEGITRGGSDEGNRDEAGEREEENMAGSDEMCLHGYERWNEAGR